MNIEKQLELNLELGKSSVIYAEKMFTVCINVKNVSNEQLYLWDFNVYPTAQFKFTKHGKPKKIKIAEQLKKFISNFRYPIQRAETVQKEKTLPEKTVQKEKTLPELTEKQVQEMVKEDELKVHYYDQIKKKRMNPKILSPGETFTDYFFVKTNKSIFFRPDKYKLALWADYSNQKDEFIRESQSKEVDVLAPITTIIVGAIFGGIMGVLARIFSTPKFRFIDILSTENLSQIIIAVIFSMLAVIAFARKSSSQTLITIPDFWGGVFIGFLAGYSEKTFIEKYILPTT